MITRKAVSKRPTVGDRRQRLRKMEIVKADRRLTWPLLRGLGEEDEEDKVDQE